jgi:hypothetical protein
MNVFGTRAPIGSLLKATAKPRKAPKPEKAMDHLEWLRTLPCLVSGRPGPCDAAHIRYAAPEWGKPITGIGAKPADRWAVPLSHDVHMEQHAAGEAKWWRKQGIDPLVAAARLWEVSGDTEAAIKIISQIQATRKT